MPEGITLKRIIDMDEAQQLSSSDYVLVDSSSGGNRKYNLGEDLNNLKEDKADIDGYYQDMTVGDAEQLVSSAYVEDSVPYNFRTTGGSADVGNREYVDGIVGGTVVWNQLVQNGNFADGVYGWGGLNSWKSYEVVDGTLHLVSTANQADYTNTYRHITNEVKVNHVYVVSYDVKASKDSSANASLGTSSGGGRVSGQTSYTANAWFHRCGLSKPTSYTDSQLYIRPKTTTDAEEVDVYLKNVFCVDLTQMFGSTIADYVYGLETATAGAGVAWFRKLFPKDYYAYNAGELMSVSGLASHDTVGFNQWDEEWELGYWNNGTKTASGTNIRSANKIPINPNTTYYIKTPSQIYYTFYDSERNFLPVTGHDPQGRLSILSSGLVTTPPGAYYMTFNMAVSYGTTYNHDICINLSWSGWRNGEYEAYQKHSYPLDDSLTLRGIPKLDAQNNLYYDGDVYEADGTVTRKYGVVDLGTLVWSQTRAGYFYTTTLKNLMKKGSAAGGYNHIKCALYIAANVASLNSLPDKSMSVDSDGNIQIHDSAYSTNVEFQSAMSGVMLLYELATPTTEAAEPYQHVQICDDFGTEEYVSTSIVSVGHSTRYPANLRDKLQHLPDLADDDGYYMIGQSNKQMHLELFRIPKAPTTDGAYTLKATVSGGTPTYTWEAET